MPDQSTLNLIFKWFATFDQELGDDAEIDDIE